MECNQSVTVRRKRAARCCNSMQLACCLEHGVCARLFSSGLQIQLWFTGRWARWVRFPCTSAIAIDDLRMTIGRSAKKIVGNSLDEFVADDPRDGHRHNGSQAGRTGIAAGSRGLGSAGLSTSSPGGRSDPHRAAQIKCRTGQRVSSCYLSSNRQGSVNALALL